MMPELVSAAGTFIEVLPKRWNSASSDGQLAFAPSLGDAGVRLGPKFSIALAMMSAGAAAQSGSSVGSTAQRSSDIVVEGQADTSAEKVTNTSTLGGLARSTDEYAQRFARCAKHVRIDLLRKIIDGEPNSRPYALALDRAIRTNAGCYMGYPDAVSLSLKDDTFFGECNPSSNDHISPFREICRAPYDRAALLIEALRKYAPDATLDEVDVNSPAVVQRLALRESHRNRLRTPADSRYLAVAICMVAAQPRLATDIVRSADDTAFQIRAARRMTATSPACTADAKRVVFDPLEFRNYIVDAFYRWVVAARDVPSLLPAND